MKKYIFKSLFLAALCAGTFFSCSEDDDSSSVNGNININNVINTAGSGSWRITSFIDSGNDETNHFTNYHFTFDDNGVLTADNTTNDIFHSGTWSVTNSDNSNDDSPNDSDIDFNIAFNSPTDFIDLNDDWDIASVTANKISLVDVSGGNGGTDILVFEKNN